MWNINREALSAHHPHLLERVEAALPLPDDDLLTTTCNRLPFTIAGRDADDQCERFIFVLGCGPGVTALYREQQHRLFRLYVIEPDASALACWLHQEDAGPLLRDPRVRWVPDEGTKTLLAFLQADLVGLGVFGASAWSANREHPDRLQTRLRVLEQVAASAWESRRVLNRHGATIQQNLLRNLPRILQSATVKAIRNRLQGHPAVVVGAGPSLDRNVERLGDCGPGHVLITTDTAAPVLQQRGLTPDFLISCDPTSLNERHFQGLSLHPDTWFAFLPETNPRVLEPYATHPRWICLDNQQSITLRRFRGDLPSEYSFPRGTNVGYCAYALARVLGCDPIILAGMDLSMPASGPTHVSGSANRCHVAVDPDRSSATFDGPIVLEEITMLQVEGYDGTPVYTLPHFAETLHHFETDMAAHSGRVIDATEGGARKRGAIHMPLHEALGSGGNTSRWKDRFDQHMEPFFGERTNIPPEALRELDATCHTIRNEARIAEQAIQRTLESRTSRPDTAAMARGIEQWFQRWRQLIHREDVSVGLDVAMARLRYETARCEFSADRASGDSCRHMLEQLRHWLQQLQTITESIRTRAIALLPREPA